ncbi:PUA-like domain-containing protein [Diplogelasinospora grovesii]|uniref:PUA-like domain-containing protein n=1 Tax=Diplogelasinospora grovesii TaxID=303347 RepID=A0AAN6NEE9_9PEZI|nr:PUA-like domain-containing protein [Diplogelasinospora grovesii]
MASTSSYQPDEAPSPITSSELPGLPKGSGSGSGSTPNAIIDVPIDERQEQLSPEKVREVVRLWQCPVCSFPLQEPITLPCGGTVCRDCLPHPYTRANITYPAEANRRQGFRCPCRGFCYKEHALGDCNPDVTLSKTVEGVKAELQALPNGPATTHVIVKDEWEQAGVPSLRDPETETRSRVLQGGRLFATYLMALEGSLSYDAEVVYRTHDSIVDDDPAPKSHDDHAVLLKIKEATRSEMDCHVCYALFFDPVTTPCGHTFCRSCLQRVLDHAHYCPVCRRALSIEPMIYRESCPTNKLIGKIITCFWADQLEERRRAVMAEVLPHNGLSITGDGDYDTAIFVCTLAFPSMPTFLHIFEPCYRLMLRRALEGDRTFGMVLSHAGNLLELGTMLRIVSVEFFPDGRSLIETVGVSRFRIVRRALLDGYIVAKTERITDISMAEEEEQEAREISRRVSQPPATPDGSGAPPERGRFPRTRVEIETTSTTDLMDFGVDFVNRMRAHSVQWLASRMLTIYGECPADPALFPWWLASILPVTDLEKYRLLSTIRVRERLKICAAWILEWQRGSSWSFATSCCMM